MAPVAATITCPACGARSLEEMPADACRFFYDCPSCAARLRPLPGDCCVFCSYADRPCPPQQKARSREASGLDALERT